MQAWWSQIEGMHLAQGDLLPDCLLPKFMGTNLADDDYVAEEELSRARLIVITQSCDLANRKANHVALCPAHRLDEFEVINPAFGKKGNWENVRKGRVEALHLLGALENPADNRSALVVDFGHIVSLPIEYLENHALSLGPRWRLNSPFLEHFSQSFARFFMRVGLPSSIPAYKQMGACENLNFCKFNYRRIPHCRGTYAKIGSITLPATSVRRKSRPW